jgi:acyl carrier protein
MMSVDRQSSEEGEPSAETSLSVTEQKVAALWREILAMPEFPRADDDFFEIGGDSMTMVMIEFRIMEEFFVQLPEGAMLTSRTLRELSTLVDENTSDARTSARRSIEHPPR